MTSPVLHPPTMKRRFQSVVRRSLSKLRHDPPVVPPKDNTTSPSASTHSRSLSQPTPGTNQQEEKKYPSRPPRSEVTPGYYHNYTQTECDGRHYEPSSPISPDQLTSSYDYDVKKGQRYYGHDDAAQYDLTAPHVNCKEHGLPLIPRQELMVLGIPPASTSPLTTTADSAIGLAWSSNPLEEVKEEGQEVEGFKAGPAYGHSYAQGTQGPYIPSAFELDRVAEEVRGERVRDDSESGLTAAPKPPQQVQQKRELSKELKRKDVATRKGADQDQWEQREGEHTWDFGDFQTALDDDSRAGIGKAVSKEEADDELTTNLSKKHSDDGPAYHHVATPAEEIGRAKGKEEYSFPRTLPEDTVDGSVEGVPAVVHEIVRPEVHEVVQQEIHRDIHHYDEHYRIQPVLDIKVLPTRHIFIDSKGNASELHFEGGKPPPGFEFGKPLCQ